MIWIDEKWEGEGDAAEACWVDIVGRGSARESMLRGNEEGTWEKAQVEDSFGQIITHNQQR